MSGLTRHRQEHTAIRTAIRSIKRAGITDPHAGWLMMIRLGWSEARLIQYIRYYHTTASTLPETRQALQEKLAALRSAAIDAIAHPATIHTT